MKSLSLILLFIVAVFSCHAQQYRPFPTGNAYWLYTINTGNWGTASSSNPSLIYRQYIMSGTDTILNGQTYKIITKREYIDSGIYSTNPVPSYTNKTANVPDEVVMAIREDNKRIMAVLFPATTEVLLYDFNKNIGDTMQYLPTINSKVIIGFDTVMVGTTAHKRWLTDNYMTDVIEGVGSIQGIFGMLNGQNTVQLACFYNTGQGSYSYGAATCFYIHKYGTPASVDSLQGHNVGVSISPNPFADRLDIVSSVPADITIYNAMSQKVIIDKSMSRKSISTTTLPNGVYFVELQNKAMNFRKVERVVK